jgi:putative FmdB family regulatory protein
VPLYEYKCLKCNRLTEKIEPVAGPHLKKCPHCGGKVEALISAPSIQFKGSGWYVTDYAGKKSAGTGSDSSKDDNSNSDKKDTASKDSSNDSGKDSGRKESSAKETNDRKDKKSEKSATKK